MLVVSRSKISLGLEFGEVGHFAFAHEAMQKFGIHSVDAQDDEALMGFADSLGLSGRMAASPLQRQQGCAKYPGYFLQRLNPQRSSSRL